MQNCENVIAKEIVDICFKIHNSYGPGLFESVYEEIVAFELSKRDLMFFRQQPIALIHEQIKLEVGFRIDFIIENKVIIELKSIESLLPVHFKQIQTYLKLTGLKLGLLVNFNVALMKEGLHRVVNKL